MGDGLAATGITQLLTRSSTGFSTLGRAITICNGKAFFSYTVSDSAGGTSTGTIEAIILTVANNMQDN